MVVTLMEVLFVLTIYSLFPNKTAEVIGTGEFPTKLSHRFSNLNKDPKLQHSFVGHK